MKILHIINGLGAGGAEALLYRLVTRQSTVDHEIVCLGPRGWYSDRLEEQGVPVHHFPLKPALSLIGTLRDLRRTVLQSRADVIHSWMYRSSLLGGILAKSAKLPCVWGIHCASLEALPLRTRFSALAAGLFSRYLSDLVVNCSERSADVHERFGFHRSTVEVIPNGYDSQIFRPDVSDIARTRERLGIGAGFLIGSITRWDPQKDIPNLLAGLRGASALGVPVRCVLVGVNLESTNQELSNILKQLELEELVTPLGKRADIPEIARALDLHVLASRSEAFPNVVAETMLCGTPNVVTDVGDSITLIGESGWIVPPRDPGKLAQAILKAYAEYRHRPDQWQARGQAAARRIAELFTLDLMAERYKAVWVQLLSRGK